MRKSSQRYLRLVALAALYFAAPGTWAQERRSLEAGFEQPPVPAMPLTWWHWINGNVSREGILADMKDMKRVGLAGAQMIDVSMYIPQGRATYGSEVWYSDIQYAIRTAHQLGLSFGMMNGPGWSGSGGPWVTPDLAMQHLVWSETMVEGGRHVDVRLAQPPASLGFYRDTAAIAVPTDRPSEEPTSSIETAPANLFAPVDSKHDGDAADATVTFRYPDELERRSLELTFQRGGWSGSFIGDVEALQNDGTFQSVRHFALQGMLGDPSLLIAFPPTMAKVFRVHLNPAADAVRSLVSMRLSDEDRIENFRSKSVSATLQPVLSPLGMQAEDKDAIPLKKVFVLTTSMSDSGLLSWDAPPGRWTILRFGYTPTGSQNHPAQSQGTGLEIDKMNAAVTDFYFEHSLGRIIRDAGPLVGTTFNSVLLDSWESGLQNWTAALPVAFRLQRGYDLEQYLPVLTGRVMVSPTVSEAFLRDFRRTVSDMVAENYYGEFRRLAEQRHLSLYAETYDGTIFNQAEAAAQAGVQMAEFWAPHMPIDDERVKSVASEAHVLGKNIVAAEAFTGQPAEAKWMWTPQTLKPIGDTAFAHGVNRFVLHSYVHQPRSDIMPGFTLSRFGTHFGRLNTWWSQAKPWLQYEARSSFLLQRGAPVSDVLALRLDEIDALQSQPLLDLPTGYAYDWVLPKTLLTATVGAQGIELPHAGKYCALVLPVLWTADLDLLRAIQQIATRGVPVFGNRPIGPSSMRDLNRMQEWEEVSNQLWPSGNKPDSERPAGTVFSLEAEAGVLESHLPPDVSFVTQKPKDSVASILWAHRRDEETDIYFLANTGEVDSRFTAEFRTGSRQPELWDAVTGSHSDAALFAKTTRGISIPFALTPGQSVFVIFRRSLLQRSINALTMGDGRVPIILTEPDSLLLTNSGDYSVHMSDGSHRLMHVSLPLPVELNLDWAVRFQPPLGTAFSRTFHDLHALSGDADARVRYFSGTATYRRIVVLDRTQTSRNQCRLELGLVHDIAAVRVNGHELGTVWINPFNVELSKWLHPGSNVIEVRVTDRWVNRLVGDEQLPPDAEYALDGGPMHSGRLASFPVWFGDPVKTALRQRTTFATWQLFTPNSRLVPSGLIGPVKLVFYRRVLPLEAEAR